jgi:outer membrane lipoprotein
MKGSFLIKMFLLSLLPLLLLWGCSVLPQEVRREADLSISFRELHRNPDAYLGRTVLLGGEILQVDNLKDQTELQILQKPLGRRDVPVEGDISEGRFIVDYSGYLDPAIYRAGRYVTTVGEVTSSRMLKVGGAEYQAPVIHSEFLRLFAKPRIYYPGAYSYYPHYYDWYWWGYPYYPFPSFIPVPGPYFHGHGGSEGHGGGGHHR